jgi:hypothetical protein
MITTMLTLPSRAWDLSDLAPETRAPLLPLLEQGGVLCLPALPAPITSVARTRLLDARHSDPRAKNISHDAGRGLKGAQADAPIQVEMSELLVNWRTRALSLVHAIAPSYQPALRLAPASLRLQQVEGRASSWRKDDSRLHIDAFPSRPNRGERILRVFHNLNPRAARVWRVGEDFETMARRFVPRLKPYRPWQASALRALRVTKSLRSEYDHLMLQLHDAMKADMDYQVGCEQLSVPFAPGSTWVCFSDQTSHAVMSGQFMLEQTLHLPVAGMQHPEYAPLRILESICQRPLV